MPWTCDYIRPCRSPCHVRVVFHHRIYWFTDHAQMPERHTSKPARVSGISVSSWLANVYIPPTPPPKPSLKTFKSPLLPDGVIPIRDSSKLGQSMEDEPVTTLWDGYSTRYVDGIMDFTLPEKDFDRVWAPDYYTCQKYVSTTWSLSTTTLALRTSGHTMLLCTDGHKAIMTTWGILICIHAFSVRLLSRKWEKERRIWKGSV